MKLKLLAMLAIAGLCAGSLAMAGNSNQIVLADDTSGQASQPAVGGSDNAPSNGSDNSSGSAGDNAGSSQDSSMPSSGDDNSSTDTGTGDDDY